MAEEHNPTFTPPVDDLRSTEDIPRDYLKYAKPLTADAMANAQESPRKKAGRNKLKTALNRFLEKNRPTRMQPRSKSSSGKTMTAGQVFTLVILTLVLFGTGVYIGDGVGMVAGKYYRNQCDAWYKSAPPAAQPASVAPAKAREGHANRTRNDNYRRPFSHPPLGRKIEPDVYLPPPYKPSDHYRNNYKRISPPIKQVPRSDRY